MSVAEAVSLPPLPATPRPWCGLWMNTCAYNVCVSVPARITINVYTPNPQNKKNPKLFGVPYLETNRGHTFNCTVADCAHTTNGHGLELTTYVTDD